MLNEQIPKGDDFKNHTYILKPLSTELKVYICSTHSLSLQY